MTLDELFAIDCAPTVEMTHALRLTIRAIDLQRFNIVDESRWTQSKINGLYQRVDPERPQMSQLRHVHVAAKKHLRASSMQAAWNNDGSRHDRKNFNDVFGSQKDVRDVARAALGLPNDFLLERLENKAEQVVRLIESNAYNFEIHLVAKNIDA